MKLKSFRKHSKSPQIMLTHNTQANYFSKRGHSPNLTPLSHYRPLKQHNKDQIKDHQDFQQRPRSFSPKNNSDKFQTQNQHIKRICKVKPTSKIKQYKRKQQKTNLQNRLNAQQIQETNNYQQKCRNQLFKYYYQKNMKEEQKKEEDNYFQDYFPEKQSKTAKRAEYMHNFRSQFDKKAHSGVKAQKMFATPQDETQALLLNSGNFRDYMKRFNQPQQLRSSEGYLQLKIQSKKYQSSHRPQMDQFVPMDLKKYNFHQGSLGKRSNYYISRILDDYRHHNSQFLNHISKSIIQLKICKTLKYSVEHQEMTKLRRENSVKQKSKHIGKKTVILDLDETLICADQKSLRTASHQQVIKFQYAGKQYKIQISIRPYARQLIKNLAQKCEVLVFTASAKDYAYAVCDFLDPQRKYIEHVYHMDYVHTTTKKDIYGNTIKIKDLRVVNRDLSQVVLIDNHAYSYAFQIENGIPILDYLGHDDNELKELQNYLENYILPAKDVREVNRKFFKQHQYLNYEAQQVVQLVQDLYKTR